MEKLYDWLKEIISLVCVFNILLQLLPSGNFKKYVRLFGGFLLLMAVLGPLAKVVNIDEEFLKNWKLGSIREEVAEMQITGQGMEELRKKTVQQAYEKEITRQVIGTAAAWGFDVEHIQLEFQESEGDAYMPKLMTLAVRRQEQIGDGEQKKNDLRKELQQVYQIPEEHIVICVQE